ncbi:unnamed protein product [Calypogeia fissa]
MAVKASLYFFGTRSTVLLQQQQQRAGVVACRWKSRQQAAMMLRIWHCVVRCGTVAFGSVEQQASGNGIEELDAKQKRQVSLFVDSLLDWNQRMNLTAVTERDAIMERHIADSLALLPIMESAYSTHCLSADKSDERLKVVDIGSGAGLPGLVLAIARPAWQVTLIESLQKRCNFLEHAAEQSGLSNITIVRARAEECGTDERFREAYDVAMARAVAEMRILSELCLPLVRVGGLFVAAKGPNPQKEVEVSRKAIRVLGASLLSIATVASEGPLGLRTAVVCHKQRPTPPKYPRSVGTPGKHPL